MPLETLASRSKRDALSRPQIMSRIRGSDTAPERLFRGLLTERFVRYRLNVAALPGKPDVVVGRLKIAVFIDGCFWHGHKCRWGRRPKSNRAFWDEKIDANRRRDARAGGRLRGMGYSVYRLATCNEARFVRVADAIADAYASSLEEA